MKSSISKFLQAFLFLLVGVVIMYFVYHRQDVEYQLECATKNIPSSDCNLLDKIMTDISRANFAWIVISMSIFVLSNVIRAFRWRMMFNAIGYQPKFFNLLGAIFINYLANLGIPRSGEFIRGTVISRYEDIPLDKALGTIVLDRALDAIMFAIFLLASLFFGGKVYIDYLNKNTNFSEKISILSEHPIILILITCLGLGVILFLWTKRRIIVESNIGKKVYGIIQGFSEGIQSVKSVSNSIIFLFQTIGIWICFFIMLYLMFFAFGPTSHLGLIAALIVFVFGSLGMLIPSPGGMGAYHYLISEGLKLNGVSGTDGFTFANILFFSIQVGITVICGLLAFVSLPILNKK